jgi:hypothetical protein
VLSPAPADNEDSHRDFALGPNPGPLTGS